MTPPLLQLRVHDLSRNPSLSSLCAGYELGRWRAAELARDLFHRHLLTFSIPNGEIETLPLTSAPEEMARAARTIYETDKYGKRGEFGELLLHAIISDFFGGVPAISKLYYKDGPNETVKGFDSIHVVAAGEDLELWLGEVKFYTDVRAAVRHVAHELQVHFEEARLRREFLAVTRKIHRDWAHAQRLKAMLHENRSLSETFPLITAPVLLTYDSEAVGNSTEANEAYKAILEEEANDAWKYLVDRLSLTAPITLRLLLLPMKSKTTLVDEMHGRLRTWQSI